MRARLLHAPVAPCRWLVLQPYIYALPLLSLLPRCLRCSWDHGPGVDMISKMLKMQMLEDEDDLAYAETEKKARTDSTSDGRPAWMRTLHTTASNWLHLIPQTLSHLKRTVENIKVAGVEWAGLARVEGRGRARCALGAGPRPGQQEGWPPSPRRLQVLEGCPSPRSCVNDSSPLRCCLGCWQSGPASPTSFVEVGPDHAQAAVGAWAALWIPGLLVTGLLWRRGLVKHSSLTLASARTISGPAVPVL